MTDYPGEVAGLPTGGPATLPAVKTYLGIETEGEDDRLTMYVAAVNSQVRSWAVAQDSADQAEWLPSTVLGAVMLCTRLDSRRNSPDGVAQFGAEGPIYVSRNDPDIAQLLGLGTWARPSVG